MRTSEVFIVGWRSGFMSDLERMSELFAEVANRFGEISKSGRVVLYCDCKAYDIADRAVFLEVSRLSKHLHYAGGIPRLGQTRLPMATSRR
jgi:hypothetical protein